MQSFIGQTINEYEFLSFINKGGFGAVYKAKKGGNLYAIKIFDEDYVLREFKKHGDNNRLQREIDIIKSLSHDNLVKYIDDFIIEDDTGKQYFLVMEYIDGTNLRNILNEFGTIPEESAIILFNQILTGVNYLHNIRGDYDDIGVIHRDLKPENILIDSKGVVKIVDFGISKVIDFTSLTSTGEIFGTGPYMSPEQITDSKNIDKRSDLYTLGVILYEMLTGLFPYDFQYQPELIEKIKSDPAIPPRKRNVGISNKTENIILKLLEKNPYERFPKISNILEEFDEDGGQEQRHYDLSPRFILRLWNDKGVLDEFMKQNKDFGYVDFPANLENVVSCRGLKNKIQEEETIKVMIDPATVRLAYGAYTEVTGVRDLPYAPTDYSIITPEVLSDYKMQKIYVKQVIDKQAELQADVLLSPFHYAHNSSVCYGPERNITGERFDLDYKLARESIDYKNDNYPEKDLYMGICIKADSLINLGTKKYLLNMFSSIESDGFMIYADGIDTKTPETILFHYITFLLELQKYTKKPVIAGRIPAGLGIGLLSLGIAGFSCGTARFESFYEGLYSETDTAYNLYARYFFPELLNTIPIKRSVPVKFDEITTIIGTCTCRYCGNKSNPEIIKDKNAHLHFLEMIYKEIEEIKENDIETNVNNFITKIDSAIETYSGLRNIFKIDEFSFLIKWRNIFTKLKEDHYV